MKNRSLILILLMPLWLACARQSETEPGAKYTCPMHPDISKSEPGSCPVCGMDLVLATARLNDPLMDSVVTLMKPRAELKNEKLETVTPVRGMRISTRKQAGVINYNPANSTTISARISGRIERLYVKYNYQVVSMGQKIMDIYSPDLVSAQQELLYLSTASEPDLLESAKHKLRIMGLSEGQISSILRSGKVQNSVTIYSSRAGYILDRAGGSVAQASTTAGGSFISGSGMNTMAAPQAQEAAIRIEPNSRLQIKEGQYVNAGDVLVKLLSTSTVWAEFYVEPENLRWYRAGSSVKIESADVPGKQLTSKVSLVQPFYKDGINYSLVRATLANPSDTWKIGELINASAETGPRMGRWLPRSAVLNIGEKSLVFIPDEGVYVPREISVQASAADWVDIGNSIAETQKVARNAWFLVDSEAFIKLKN